jgi:hypothetical protein
MKRGAARNFAWFPTTNRKASKQCSQKPASPRHVTLEQYAAAAEHNHLGVESLYTSAKSFVEWTRRLPESEKPVS